MVWSLQIECNFVCSHRYSEPLLKQALVLKKCRYATDIEYALHLEAYSHQLGNLKYSPRYACPWGTFSRSPYLPLIQPTFFKHFRKFCFFCYNDDPFYCKQANGGACLLNGLYCIFDL